MKVPFGPVTRTSVSSIGSSQGSKTWPSIARGARHGDIDAESRFAGRKVESEAHGKARYVRGVGVAEPLWEIGGTVLVVLCEHSVLAGRRGFELIAAVGVCEHLDNPASVGGEERDHPPRERLAGRVVSQPARDRGSRPRRGIPDLEQQRELQPGRQHAGSIADANPAGLE